MTRTTTPTLSRVIRRAIETSAADLHVSLPGRIERFDATRCLADVKPLLKDSVFEEGERRVVSVPIITNVPVVFPGAGGFRLTFPVAEGDGCLLVFSDRSLDRWLERGGEIDPGDERRHALSDAVALLGLRDFSNPWSGVATDAATIGKQGGEQVVVKAAEIQLGTNASHPAVLGDALQNWIDDLRSWLTTLTLPSPTGPAGPPPSPPPAPRVTPPLNSAVVKVKE